jgi:hypothetical protein
MADKGTPKEIMRLTIIQALIDMGLYKEYDCIKCGGKNSGCNGADCEREKERAEGLERVVLAALGDGVLELPIVNKRTGSYNSNKFKAQRDADQAIYDEDTAALEARIKELEKEQLTPIEAQFLLADYGGCGCKVCKGLVSKLKSIAKGDTK